MSHIDPLTPHAGGPDPAPETFGAADLLADLPVLTEDRAALEVVRVTAAVAAALRAALDWLTGELGSSRPLRARADDAALEIVLEHADGRGLRAAGEVLAVVGGSLGRVETVRPDAPWVVRVPIHAEREQYLMVIEAGLPIAFPWPAVLHIVMAREEELNAGLSAPRVPPLVAELGRPPAEIAPDGAEVPVVLIGLGLKRGYYVAERLVWRLSAVTIETVTPPPAPGLTRAVQSEEGDCYWVADPAWLLHTVDEPALDLAAPAERPPATPILGEADVHPIGFPDAEVTPVDEGALDSEPPPVFLFAPEPVIEPEPSAPVVESRPPAPVNEPEPPAPVVESLPPAPVMEPILPAPVNEPEPPAPVVESRPSAPVMEPEPPAPMAGSRPSAPPSPPSPPRSPARSAAAKPAAKPTAPNPPAGATIRAALVAEDSLTASIFLARLLEKHGFIVRTVETAAELARELARGDWALVCVDVELPDRRGREHLLAARTALERAHAGRPVPPALIALVRDLDDAAAAQAAGITRVLRKPFDRDALAELLRRIGITTGGAS